MSFPIFKSTSNTIVTALGVTDSAVNGIGSGFRIFETSMANAERDVILDGIREEESNVKLAGLSEEALAKYNLRTAHLA